MTRVTTGPRVALTGVAVLLAAAGLLVGVASEARAASASVEIGDGFFGPADVTVTVGDSVTWTNVDNSPHTVTASGAFDSGNIEPGGTFTFEATAAGTFTYVCLYHSDMVGTITVVEAAPAAPAASAAAGGGGGTTAASGTTDGAAHSGDSQPDTALPVSDRHLPGWVAPLLIGLGLVAFAVALLPERGGTAGSLARERPTSGWRR